MVMLVNCGGDGGSEVSGESAGGREPWWRNNDRKRKNWGGVIFCQMWPLISPPSGDEIHIYL